MASNAPSERRRTPTPYEAWVQRQGIPIVQGYGVTDLREPELAYWDRLGCPAYFVILEGMEGITGMYVAEIPAGGATNREQHLYEKVIYVLEGSGSTTLADPDGKTHQFEWQAESLFAIPLNVPHRLFAAGKPVRYAAFTTAPLVFDLFYNEEFVYHTPFAFRERYAGEPDYLSLDVRHPPRGRDLAIWETNFIPNVRTAVLDAAGMKGQDLLLTQFEIASNSLIGHLAKWPEGRYHKAHHHGGGAILLIVQSEGYSLMWPSELGEHPYERGFGDQVVRVDWKSGSVFSPPTAWFHQHFNTGPETALQLALRNGSRKFPFGVRRAQTRNGVMQSTRQGGTLIEYEDEDPAIMRLYEEALARTGVPCRMATASPRA
jgi:oxalate decarboxylase/phosphoglucose isomerase-like protein (cupin superfamily)